MNAFTQASVLLFAVFSAYMMWAARSVKKAVKSQSRSSRAAHVAILVSAFAFSFTRIPSWGFLGLQWIPNTPSFGFLGAAVCAAGVAFCFWARWTLGSNWSGTVTLKKDHELIQRGPYRLARNPMYTGILAGLLGAAITVGQVVNILAVALLTFSFIRKMGLEETYLRAHFGQSYDAYARKVKRLIPYVY